LIEADVQEKDEIENVGNLTLSDHRREVSRVQKRQDDVLGSRDTKLNCRTGSTGYLQHSRLGLIGWVSYCSRGHIDSAVHMSVQLIERDLFSQEMMTTN